MGRRRGGSPAFAEHSQMRKRRRIASFCDDEMAAHPIPHKCQSTPPAQTVTPGRVVATVATIRREFQRASK
jgi:hypothetical protein